MQTLKIAVLFILGLGAGISQPCAAADEWQYEVTPYLLAAGMDGTVGVRDHETDIDVPFSDIWDDLDAGFMGLFTAHKGRWLLALEGV